VAYFVDCGDRNVNTVSGGEALGKYNSVTEQVYGEDAVTGRKWGIVDNIETSTWGTAGALRGVFHREKSKNIKQFLLFILF